MLSWQKPSSAVAEYSACPYSKPGTEEIGSKTLNGLLDLMYMAVQHSVSKSLSSRQFTFCTICLPDNPESCHQWLLLLLGKFVS